MLAKLMTDPKQAPELLAEAAAQPTLDEYLRRDPKDLTKADRRALTQVLRDQRAAVIKEKE